MVVDDILAIRERWHTKRHPFFGALGGGKLPLRVLGIYMAMHWQFVQRALASFGILFTRTFSQEDVRKMIVENLAEEEGLKAIPREVADQACMLRWASITDLYRRDYLGEKDVWP